MSSSPSPSLSRCCLVSTVSHSVTVLHRHLSTSTEVQIARSTFPNLSTMASSQNTEENSLDPNSPHTNRVHAFPQPLVQIVGFELPGLPSERNLVPPFLRQPGLCNRGPAGLPLPIDPIERLRPRYAKSLITEALRPYSTPEPPYSGALWPQHQGLQICKTWPL